MKVVIDGKTFVPASGCSSEKIGVAITTTLERPEAYERAFDMVSRNLPDGADMIIVVDGVETAERRKLVEDLTGYDVKVLFTLEEGDDLERAGIPRAKNTCLAAMKHCDHMFLFDDDAWPVKRGWERPYIESSQHHLSYQFADVSGDKKLGDMKVIYGESNFGGNRGIIGFTGQRGVMLYYTRKAIDTVGGFDTNYGMGMFEHMDLAMRIYAAGLTATPFGDVNESADYFYSLDEHQQVKRTLPSPVRDELNKRNSDMYNRRADHFMTHGIHPALFFPLPDINKVRKTETLYITTVLTGTNDPQRPGQKFDFSGVKAWYDSIIKNDPAAHVMVLTDNPDLKLPVGRQEYLPIHANQYSVYFRRWMFIRDYLSSRTELYENVFITDATDVVLLNKPDISSPRYNKTLFVGSEHDTLASPWMVNNHLSTESLQMFQMAGSNAQLLNAGISGGRTEVVMKLVNRICQIAQLRQAKAVFDSRVVTEQFDMGAFNLAAYEQRGFELSYGPHINTVFKTEGHGAQRAWFKHK